VKASKQATLARNKRDQIGKADSKPRRAQAEQTSSKREERKEWTSDDKQPADNRDHAGTILRPQWLPAC